jgi:hypothetical protein
VSQMDTEPYNYEYNPNRTPEITYIGHKRSA